MNKYFMLRLSAVWLIAGFLFVAWPASAQSDIRGRVTDAANQSSLAGVNIRVKGTVRGTSTDAEGRFQLSAASSETLVFSIIGYETKEVTVGNQTDWSIALQPAARSLNEVVVTALGIERQTRSLGYATQQISGASLTAVKDPGANLMNSLSGKVAGAVITPTATGPGGAVRVVLRGNRSISGNNNALIVVDGVPIDNTMSTEQGGGGSANTIATQPKGISSGYSGSDGAASINPQDVESVTVLKGPAAAALYGSRAANGALIITTKSGKSGALSVNYNGSVAIDEPFLLQKFQNTYGRGNGGKAGAEAAGSWGAAAQTYSNNVRDFYRTGSSLTNSVDLSGGNEKIRGYVSYTHNRNEGIVPRNGLERSTVNLRLNARPVERLTTDVKITYMDQRIRNKPRLGDTGIPNEANIMPRDLSPAELAKYETIDATGKPVPVYWTNSSIYRNPNWDVYRTSLNEDRSRIMMLGTAKYQLTDWLSLQGRYSLDRYDDNIMASYYDGTVALPVQPGGRYLEGFIRRSERNMDILLSGNNKIANGLNVSYNVGASTLHIKGNNTQALANGLSIPNQFNLNFATTPAFSNLPFEKKMQSVYGNVQFDFRQLLYLDVSARNDWSSTLPAPHSYFYPSVGLSTVVSEWLHMPSWVSFGKVRASYTQVGNDADPYLLMQTYSFSQGSGNGFVSRDNVKYISNLKPEKTRSYELGMEWKFLDGRLGLDATVYQSNTINQLIFIGLPQATGYSQQYINAGNIQNKGLEISLTGDLISRKDFRWTSTLNFARNINKVLSLSPGITQANLSSSTALGSLLVKPGQSYGDIYDYAWTKDANGRYVVNASGLPTVTALQKLGNFNPDFTLGWNNTLSYKRFNLSFLIDGRVGGILVSGTDATLAYFGVGDYTTRYREGGLVLNGVKADGSANTTAINAEQFWTSVSQGGRTGYGQFFAFSTTNFRLRELSLGYNLSLKTKAIRNARVSLTARNLLFLYRGKSILDIPGIGKRTIPVDPESAIGTSNYQGIESGMLPLTRSIGLNLSLSF